MKIRNTIICLGMAFLLTLTSGCFGKQKTYNLFSGSYWLEDSSVSNVGNVDETCVYNINLAFSKDAKHKNTLNGNITGTYTTHLTNSTIDGEKCYLLKSTLKTSGEYQLSDKKEATPVDDEIISEVYFSGLQSGSELFPLKSNKTVKSTTPVLSMSTDKISIVKVDYSVDATYNKKNKTAKISVKPHNEDTIKYGVKEKTREYDKLAKGGSYFDNETLFFVPRASKLEGGYQQRFQSIDPLTQAMNRFSIYVDANNPTHKFTVNDFTENGVKLAKDFVTYKLTMTMTGTFSGSPVHLYYDSSKTGKNRLAKIESSLPYNLGIFSYTLKEIK